MWMRVAALPSFKKLYRKIPAGSLKKSTKYELVVSNRFPVEMFKGYRHALAHFGFLIQRLQGLQGEERVQNANMRGMRGCKAF